MRIGRSAHTLEWKVCVRIVCGTLAVTTEDFGNEMQNAVGNWNKSAGLKIIHLCVMKKNTASLPSIPGRVASLKQLYEPKNKTRK